MFFALNEIDICNFAYDTTPYVCDSNLKSVLEKLEHNSELAIAWFEMNYMKLNTDQCHFLISGNKNEYMLAKLDKDIVWGSHNVELLGVTIDNNLRFDKLVSNISLKANKKLKDLRKVPKFVPFKKGRVLLNRGPNNFSQ